MICEYCGQVRNNKPRNRYCSTICSNRAKAATSGPKRRSPEERFWEKVNRRSANECWEWTASRGEDGYGHFVPNPKSASTTTAHRYADILTNGPMPEGYESHHKCENRGCCNPNHLERVTTSEHLLLTPKSIAYQMASKTHCKRGHLLAETARITRDGRRDCRACQRERYHERKRANALDIIQPGK